jgi:hypothetical protein
MKETLLKLSESYQERQEEIGEKAREFLERQESIHALPGTGTGLRSSAREVVFKEIREDHPQWAEQTLNHMLAGRLYDRVEGGFFRYSMARDWSMPHYEKMLADNAQVALLLLRLYLITRKRTHADYARETLNYVNNNLRDGRGHFYGSQDADEHYYSLDAAARFRRAKPQVDTITYADSSSLAILAFPRAGKILSFGLFKEVALRGLRVSAEELYSGEQRMSHFMDGKSRKWLGLLEDQVMAAQAFPGGYRQSGDRELSGKAERPAELITAFYWQGEGGMLYDLDTRSPIAILNREPAEIGVSAQAALVLSEIATLTGKDYYLGVARKMLERFSSSSQRYSRYAATYAVAVDRVLNPPLLVVLRGKPSDQGYRKLLHVVLALSPAAFVLTA